MRKRNLERKKRKCLRCNKEFISKGKENRICSNCKISIKKILVYEG